LQPDRRERPPFALLPRRATGLPCVGCYSGVEQNIVEDRP
jgi:hypothetical protein